MEIDKIRKKIKHSEYEISFHAEKERYAEDIVVLSLDIRKVDQFI